MDISEINDKKNRVYEFIKSDEYKPMSRRQIAQFMQVPKQEKSDFNDVIDLLSIEGYIKIDSKGKISNNRKSKLTGTISTTMKGVSFVRLDDSDEEIFISKDNVLDALNGDKVSVKIFDEVTGKHREGRVTEVVSRARDNFVCTIYKADGLTVAIPDDRRIQVCFFMYDSFSEDVMEKNKVVVKYVGDDVNPSDKTKLLRYIFSKKVMAISEEDVDRIDKSKFYVGEVTEVIGHADDPGVDILSIVKKYNISEEFPKEVLDKAEKTPRKVEKKDIKGRKDYRDLPTVTIDGEEAKDLDDAITIEKKKNHFTLGVHIADVSHYVTENSPLDKEALKRGTSIYLTDRVIPMIPHRLSNGICSLNAGEDRLTLSCVMDIDFKGKLLSYDISESVINVDRRMSYNQVHKIVEENDPELNEAYKELVPDFQNMYELAAILRNKRFKEGSIDFDLPESKITLDEEGVPVDVSLYERNDSHKLIEEFMLQANRTVAEHFFWQEIPFLYRIHEEPEETKISSFLSMCLKFGVKVSPKNGSLMPKELQKILNKLTDKPGEKLLNMLALRSMSKARYSTKCVGHYGLSMEYYCHFTSPIRRYPDLQIHRIIKESLNGKLNSKRLSHYEEILKDVAERTSDRERVAIDCEREVDDMKKAEYMSKFIGEKYTGEITSLTSFGIYVTLPNSIEGMINLAELKDDYYIFDEANYVVVGKRLGKEYSVGDELEIEVLAASKYTGNIDFGIPSDEDKDGEKPE